MANILAGPLQAVATSLCNHLASRATVILSGLLPHQRGRILARYRTHGLRHVTTRYRNGWLILVLEKIHRANKKAGPKPRFR
jgi:ribosomal protein L11 methyltransferase